MYSIEMFDVIVRALRDPLDYLPVINRRTLLLQEIHQESEDMYSFIFKPKKPFTWKAGQHGIFMFPRTKVEGKFWRAFSIASSSQELVVRISTIIKDEPSDFKKKLKAMQVGDEFLMHGPFGEFHTSNKISRIIGIAGGIGITPFRALLKDIASGVITHTNITLIYSALTYTYKEELDQLSNHPYITIIYTTTPEEVNAELEAQIEKVGNSASYFISGSPGMIGAIRKKLKGAGIRHIVNDSFKGY
jgi:ferredoxin-NADP reductase